jgi:two-component system cell cycle response regulator
MDQQLANRVRKYEGLPSLPAIAVQVLELVRHSNCDIPQLARLISKDPALASKILRTINSSMYVRPNKVSKLTQALTLLGLQTVRVLVLGFSLVRNLKFKNKGFKPLDYWRRSIYSATAALTLAQRIGIEQQEEAFVASLLMDIGMLVLDDLLGESYGKIIDRARGHGDLCKIEDSVLQTTHAQVSGLLAEAWGLPECLSVPMGAHHTPNTVDDTKLRELSNVCYLAGRCADVFVEESAAHAIVELRKFCESMYSISEADCDTLLNQISKRTAEIAPLFDVALNTQISYEEILKKANDSVIELTLASQARERQEQDRRKEEDAARATATLLDRAKLDEILAAQMQPHASRPVAVIVMAIDGANARDVAYGTLCKLIQSAIRPTDIVGWFTESQIMLVLPNVSRTDGVGFAENIRRALAAQPASTLPVTLSAGVVGLEADSPFKETQHVTRALALSLTAAQRAGGNCVRAFSIKMAVAA